MVDSRVTIDEAVQYGFHMLLGIFKYLIIIGILTVIGLALSFSDSCMALESSELICVLLPTLIMIISSFISSALTIGVLYKLIADASN